MIEIKGDIFINKDGEGFFGQGRYKLLKLIDKYGSISKAAKEMKMSYKAAWDHIQSINNLAQEPVVYTKAGGKDGGQTILTPYGKRLLKHYERIQEEYQKFLELLKEEELESLYVIRRLDMKLSARNQLLGKVSAVEKAQAVSEVVISIRNGATIKSVITTEAVDTIDLKPGKDVVAIVKSSDVILGVGEEVEKLYPLSVRNILKGDVKQIVESDVNSLVKVDIGAELTISSVITTESLKELGIKEGSSVYVIIKASNVMIYVI
ncbi:MULTISPECIES: TOBE domain-containing protein [unclassified Hydrogenobaculum]|uniref:TOBE domain-containing protein n=1 Tax=unclassified Hydrogenobaculum TaxID=2622382 RepID=UPI0001C50372|nr:MULTISPECIES: TOBE domain-containing protein [unclassified Hydrogenobaculum]AEF19319.1 transcriptional regulator, ModE family [Hydrogenobaculum sp. 3684]AEG46608.1 transcriptional regulator, ModE family [Hydrogenobaculum sp. SHO]AGG15252.1 transcriptional regulator, ModE family [Hydrogenobaculum sp. HO]AGH93551.1 ModE molybdate transport repressor domain/molybdenum-pterin binding domain protein [Hydrogenobaculum sp. SN]